MDQMTLICDCHSFEHQLVFWYDEEDEILYIMPHLSTKQNFMVRFWLAIKYIFGYRSKFRAWDEMLVSNHNLDKLRNYLNNCK